MNAELQRATSALWLNPEQSAAFHKGRVAWYAILRAAGIGPGDEVLIPGYTCVVVPAAVIYAGATPVFYDLRAGEYHGDENAAIRLVGARTRAVLVQHTFGIPVRFDRLNEICRARGVIVVEDCAHALGAGIDGQPVGASGDAAFCSFQWSKPLTLGLGGLARINRMDLMDSVRDFQVRHCVAPRRREELSLAFLRQLHRLFLRPRVFWPARDAYRRLSRLGLFAGSSSAGELVSAAMPEGYCRNLGAWRQRSVRDLLNGLPDAVAHRQAIAAVYREELSRWGDYVRPLGTGVSASELRLPLQTRHRDSLLARARKARIELGDWFSAPLHPPDSNEAAFGYVRGSCPQAEQAAARVFNLPTHPNISPSDARRILRFVEQHRSDLVPLDALEPSDGVVAKEP